MRIHRARACEQGLIGGVGIALGTLLGGCNSFDKPASESGPHLVIPVDERPAVSMGARPHAVSGGTMTVLKDGTRVIVADPDRDRISVVDLKSIPYVSSTVTLHEGDEPGRSVEDANRHVHVVFRGSGTLATLDPSTGTVLERRAVCKTPRGLAFDPVASLVHVACAEGTLVSLPAAGGPAVRTLTLQPDLRDVIVQGDKLWVTRFKSAEVLEVDATGAVSKRIAPQKLIGQLQVPSTDSNNPEVGVGTTTKEANMSPAVAWRAVANPSGGAVLVHQEEVDDSIDLTPPTAGGSAYGGGGLGCDGIVKNALTTVNPDGTTSTATFGGSPLPVDVAISSSSSSDQWIAIAHAGVADAQAPRPFMEVPENGSPTPSVATGGGFGSGSGVTLLLQSNVAVNAQMNTCAFPVGFVPVSDPVTAVAFTPQGQLLVLSAQSARLSILQSLPNPTSSDVDLFATPLVNTGHELFHRDAGGGIACASCHPEGGEDGHTWHFSGAGARRTQALHVGLRDTAPFHWAGDLADVDAVMKQVFVGRMGGVNETAERTAALSEWLFGMERPAALRDGADPAAVRGKALFESAGVGCSSCHSGPKLTNNQTVAIDSAREKLQVPSLLAVGYRAPFMHDGCAATLADRFDPACGGNQHGNVSGLSPAEKNDLVAYLESL
jgi:hypothetical protein